jgi:fructokinase
MVDAPTSTATAILDESGSASYEFSIQWSLDFVDHLHETEIVHTGSIAAFLEPGASRLEALLVARQSDATGPAIITFDPNIRPSIIGSREDSAAIVDRLAKLATVVKVSDEDALWLYGKLTPDEIADRLLALGATLAIVTLGASGALLATTAQRISVPGERVEVADTIGAGDSFMSAVIEKIAALLDAGVSAAAIADGSALDRAVLAGIGEFAVGCAAITVSRPGANPPTAAEAAARVR